MDNQDQVKLCVECKYFEEIPLPGPDSNSYGIEVRHDCLRLGVGEVCLVTGRHSVRILDCHSQRREVDQCYTTGRFWTPKDA